MATFPCPVRKGCLPFFHLQYGDRQGMKISRIDRREFSFAGYLFPEGVNRAFIVFSIDEAAFRVFYVDLLSMA